MSSAPADLARSALDAAPDAMIIIDETGIIAFANRQAAALFGYAHEELVGHPVELLMPERFRVRHLAHRGGYVYSPRLRPMGQGLELYGRRRDGAEFPVEISLSPIESPPRPLVAAAIRDVTERKRVEGELILARQQAEEAGQIAERANRAKSRFLATASHDLRQPLQTLALLNGTLRRTVSGAEAEEAVAQQEQAIGAMSRLLNALLDISKLESGAVKPDPSDFAVSGILDELRREFASVAAGKGLAFDVENCGACAHSDSSLIEQVLRNLVSNAIKYTRRGRVALRCLLAPGHTVCIEVLDTGIGIPADQIDSIYDEFHQVGVPANSSRDGYGLGLAIVKRIVELLALRLDVRSQVGVGSAFSLFLPAALGPVEASSSAPRLPQRRTSGAAGPIGRRVLLVEDDSGVRDATRMLLKVEGYQVTAVASLEEALVAARGGTDLLVTDYHLRDGETGTQVISALRATLGPSLKSVLVTGDTSTAIREIPFDPDMRIASKPIRAEELLTLLRTLSGEISTAS